jgi:hypothetical protein
MELKITRIELLGEASKEIYDKLHSYMENMGWARSIYTNVPNTKTVGPLALPTATYCGNSNELSSVLAERINGEIQSKKIWAKPRVLVMGVGTNWAIRGF